MHSATGTLLSRTPTPTENHPSAIAYNPVTGHVYAAVEGTGILVVNPDFTTELLPVPVEGSVPRLTALPDGRIVFTSGSDEPVSLIETDNTFTSYPLDYAAAATMNATGTVFVSSFGTADGPGMLIIHPDGTTETLSPPARTSGIVYDAATDRIVVASLNSALVSIIKPVAAAITPISVLTPADGATVEPGFTVTGTGEYGSAVSITNDHQPGTSIIDIANPDGSWSARINDVFAPGTHTLTFTQHADGSVDTLTFSINAAPVITPVTITGPDAGSTVGLRPTLTGAGTPDATVGATGTWTFTPTADLALGAHTFTATQDVDSSTASVAVTVAATAPSPSPSPTPGTGAGTGELSSTGADAAPLILSGGLLAAAGITAAVLGRRKLRQSA